jgi:hypothetical protein
MMVWSFSGAFPGHEFLIAYIFCSHISSIAASFHLVHTCTQMQSKVQMIAKQSAHIANCSAVALPAVPHKSRQHQASRILEY